MWVPLVILAGLSFSFWYSGWFGDLVRKPASAIPAVHALKGSPAGAHAAIPAPSRGGGFGLASRPASASHAAAHDLHLAHVAHTWSLRLSILFAGSGIGLAFVVYLFGWINPGKVASTLKPVHTFLVNKWYFDELYEATAVNGTKALSRALGWFDLTVVDGLVNLCAHLGVWFSYLTGKFDNTVVDGAVNGVADVTIGSGSFFRRFQTGKLYHYVFILAGGGVLSQFQFVEHYRWIPSINVEYFLGADGISMPMIMLTTIVSFLAVVGSWGIEKQIKGYMALRSEEHTSALHS